MSSLLIPVGTKVETYDGPGTVVAHTVEFGQYAYRVLLDSGGPIVTFDSSRIRRA